MKYFAPLLCLLATSVDAFNVVKSAGNQSTRRDLIQTVAGAASAGLIVGASPLPALASGGATAGKYT